ncbi:MAG: glycosyltransferase [Deltaproteobacteria bacterium]|nr:glycosyltransferase [Deltaproteobacteria bacterium]
MLMLGRLKTQGRRIPGAQKTWQRLRRIYDALDPRSERRAPRPPIVRSVNLWAPEPSAWMPGASLCIVVAVRNDASNIGRCLESVLRQDFADWTCVVVDDRSSDQSVAIAERFAARDPRFRVIRQQAFSGTRTTAKNTGVRTTTARAVLFLEPSSTLLPGRPCALRTAILKAERAAQDDDDGRVAGIAIDATSVVLRRDVFLRLGGFDESLGQDSESDFWGRLTSEGYVLNPSHAAGMPHAEIATRHPPHTYEHEREREHAREHRRGIRNSDVETQREAQIVFAPHKDYHAWTMLKAVPRLEARGIPFVFIDSTGNHLDEGARARIRDAQVPWISYNNYCFGQFSPRLFVVMNDWEPQIRALVEDANAKNQTTVALIEGVQDFTDADILLRRAPYQRTRHVLLSGAFDQQFFSEKTRTQVVGVPRIDELRTETCAFPAEPLVVANSNFSYYVLTDKQAMWLRSVKAACRRLGVRMVVSRHPADHGDFSGYDVTPWSMYEAIRRGSIFVSRFGSGIIEALAMGKPAIYHNPHGERVIKFGEPMGAYPVTHDVDGLVRALEKELGDRTDRRDRARAFLDHHVAWSAPKPSTQLFADALIELCGSAPHQAREDVGGARDD